MSAKAILDAVQVRLMATSFTNGTRYAFGQVEADTALPLFVWDVERADTTSLFGGAERFEVVLAFTIHQSPSDGVSMHTISSEIKSAMTADLAATGFDRVSVQRISSGTPSYDDDSWSMTDRYRAVGHRTS